MTCVPAGYKPCHNAEEVVERLSYNPEADLDNPTGSVFCSHGAGFVVEWNQVEEYAHVDSGFKLEEIEPEGTTEGDMAGYALTAAQLQGGRKAGDKTGKAVSGYISQEEIEEIFRQTYGKRQEDINRFRRYHKSGRRNWRLEGRSAEKGGAEGMDGSYSGKDSRSFDFSSKKEEYLLVDGYNIIFAWQELKELAAVNIDSARDRLIDILSNYQGYLGSTVIVVFDAYKVKGNPGSALIYHNIHVVYTKEAETADQYIEKTVHEIGRKYQVTVATSDALEQMIIWGEGAVRMSAQGLFEAVERAKENMRKEYGV